MSMYDQPASFRNRRTSFGAGQAFAPYTDPFRPSRDGFNDPYNTGYSEVSGPTGPPATTMPIPNAPPPPASSQQFQPAGGYGSYPPPGAMGTSYSMGTREQTTSPPEPSGFDPTGVPPRTAYPDSYDNSPLSDSYFPPQLDDGFGSRGRAFSTGGGFGPPALLPSAAPPPMTPHMSTYSSKRVRRASSVGPGFGIAGHMSDPYRHSGGAVVKFRPSGGHRDGISLNEAMNSLRLSRSNSYSLREFPVDGRGRITLKVRVRFFHLLSFSRLECPLHLTDLIPRWGD
jgi:hypothetical protein